MAMTAISARATSATPNSKAMVGSARLAEELIELRVARRLLIEELIKSFRFGPDILGKGLRIEQFGEPAQPDQAIGAGRLVDPAERIKRFEIDALVANRFHALPARIVPDRLIEV